MAVLVYGIKILIVMRLDGHQLLAGEQERRDYQILCFADSPQTVVCKWLTVTVAINLMILALEMKNLPSLPVLMCNFLSMKEHQAYR